MECVRKLTKDLYWVGADDRRLELLKIFIPFLGAYPTMPTSFWTKNGSFRYS